jgi:transposase
VFGLGPATRVYLAVGATDLRKGFEGLFGLVKDRLELEPLSEHVIAEQGSALLRPRPA